MLAEKRRGCGSVHGWVSCCLHIEVVKLLFLVVFRFLFGTCCLLKGQEHNGSEADGDYIEEMPQSNLAAVSSYERYGSAQGDSYLDKKKYQNEYDFQMDPDMVEKYEKLNEATGYYYSTTSMPERDAHTTTMAPMVDRQPTTTTNEYQDETVAPTTNVYLPNLSSHKYSAELPTALLNRFANQDIIVDESTSSIGISSSTLNTIDDIFTSSNIHYLGNLLRENVDSTTNREFTDITYEDDSNDSETSYPTTVFYRRPTTTTERPHHSTRVTYPKPQFRPKPTKDSTNNYILVQTVSNERYNDTKATVSEHNLESIESIILMLNDTNPGPSYDTDMSTERIAADSTEASYYSTYSDEYETTQYSTNRYSPVTRRPGSRPSFHTTTFQPDSYQEETEIYSSPYSQTKRPNIEAILSQSTIGSTYSYYEPSSPSSTQHYYPSSPSSSNYVSVTSSKKPYSRPTTQVTYSTSAPIVEIIKTTVGSKRPSTITTSAGTKANKVKVTSSSSTSSTRPSSTSTFSRPSSSSPTSTYSRPTSSRPSSSSTISSTRPPSSTVQRIKVSSTQKQTTSSKGTRKPPSTSYVYSPYPTRRPGTPEKTSTSAKPTKKVSQAQLITAGTRLPAEYIVQSKPVTQARPTASSTSGNSYISLQDSVTNSRPNPTVHITPKPNVNLITSSNYGSSPGGISSLRPSASVSNKISSLSPGNLPQGGISVIYNENPAVLIPAPADFDNEGYFGVSTTVRPMSDQHLVTQTSIFTIGKRPSTIHVFAPTTPSSVSHYNDIDDYKTGAGSTIPIKGVTHAAADDLINFPPVRNPNLNLTNGVPPGVHTGVNFSDEELSETTPIFIEDEILHNKMDLLVSKIVASLQNNFDNLADMVYERRNVTILKDPTEDAATLKPNRRPTTKKPATTTKKTRISTTSTRRPLKATSKKPASTKKPTSNKRPTTKRPVTKVRV